MTVHILGTAVHRNGVGGDPFVCVRFRHEDSDSPLIAVIPTRCREEPASGALHTYVVHPTDPDSKWRGDRLYADLLAAGLWERVQVDSDARMSSIQSVISK